MLKRALKSGLTGPLLVLLSLSVASPPAFANPTGPSVVAGGASVSGIETGHVTIDQTTPQAILHWEQFNIAPGELTQFIQPSAQAIALNRIFDANPSQILGRLQANGSVILLNPNGVLFGRGAQVNVNGLIASSLNLTDSDFLNGRYAFQGSPLQGSVQNAGTIETAAGGFVYLLAPNVENGGVIKSPEGQITLAAGTTAYLSNRPDGRGFLVEVTAPSGEALNLSELAADGGKISLFGRVVNQSGVIRANSIREKSGRIEFYATERIALKEGSRITAKGGEAGVSDGGSVIVLADKSAGETRFDPGASIDVSGGGAGGDGGFVELSGRDVNLGGRIDGSAAPGYRGGTLLIDPHDDTVDQTVFDGLVRNQTGMANILVEADHNLRVVGVTTDPAAYAPPEGLTLRFTAGGDLIFSETKIGDIFTLDPSSPVWNLAGTAGNRIILEGSSLVGNGGRFDLTAGGNIELRQGVEHSYLWAALGGEIVLKAGGDLIAPSALDQTSGSGWYSGIRLASLLSVERTAPRLEIDVAGSFLGVGGVLPVGPGFVLTGGTADVTVGDNIGAPDNYANLTLGKGEIRINAGGDLYLGMVQDWGLAETGVSTVDPGNRTDLAAGGNIHLRPSPNLNDGLSELKRIYPASFSADAGGSIFIETNLSFWPSLTGSLLFAAQEAIEGKGGQLHQIKLFAFDPALVGSSTDILKNIVNRPIYADPAQIEPHEAQPVRFVTGRGDIRNLAFDFNTPFVRKEFEIASGNDLADVRILSMWVPEGMEGVVRAEGDILVGRSEGSFGGGFSFLGAGNGIIRAGGDLDLGTSPGIRHYVGAGFLDISVGRNLEMTESSIVTYNGAAIRIHGLDGPESAVGGRVNVGTNAGSRERQHGEYRGIITLRGGGIDIRATGDVNVNRSQVSTLGGGNIRILSTAGDINAGFGSADEVTEFSIQKVVFDENGNPKFKNDGSGVETTVEGAVQVPGSGIFTYHSDDPSPLPPYPPKPTVEIPPFQPTLPPPPPEPTLPPFPDQTPRMAQLEGEILKQRILGHDTSGLERAFLAEFERQARDYEAAVTELYARYRVEVENYRSQAEASYQNQLQAYREQIKLLQQRASLEYEAIKAEHRKEWKFGDIELTAPEAAVVVPPAGIRGRKITIVAKALDLQGGEIGGETDVNVEELIGDRGDLEFTGRIGEEVLTAIEIELPPIPTVTLPPLPSITLPSIPTGGGTAGASLGGLSGSTGSLSAATSGSVATASAAVATVQEKVAEQAGAEAPGAAPAEPTGGAEEGATGGEQTAKKKGSGKVRTFQIRRGVLIQVEVNEEQP